MSFFSCIEVLFAHLWTNWRQNRASLGPRENRGDWCLVSNHLYYLSSCCEDGNSEFESLFIGNVDKRDLLSFVGHYIGCVCRCVSVDSWNDAREPSRLQLNDESQNGCHSYVAIPNVVDPFPHSKCMDKIVIIADTKLRNHLHLRYPKISGVKPLVAGLSVLKSFYQI